MILSEKAEPMKTLSGIRKRKILLPALLCAAALVLLLCVHAKRETAFSQQTNIRTLVIDPGHGGIDCGALGADGTRESDINLAIALRTRAVAELYGLENTLVRQDDTTSCDTEKYSERRDLECRTEIVNTAQNPIYISIHQNNYPTAQPGGAQVIYSGAQGSKELGLITHQNLINALYPENRRLAEPASRKLYILSHVDCPAILVECGFMSNTLDLENLKRPGFQISIASILIGSYLQFDMNTNSI